MIFFLSVAEYIVIKEALKIIIVASTIAQISFIGRRNEELQLKIFNENSQMALSIIMFLLNCESVCLEI